MSRHGTSLPSSYFDDIYARDPDPWRFTESTYERDKYKATLGALRREAYRNALEVGCSIGVLSRLLAEHCVRLLSLDVAAAALDLAKRRCADQPHVRFERHRVPAEWPEGRFDLIVLSEVVYYLDRDDVARLVSRVAEAAIPGCDILLVHWLGETHYPLSGDDAAEAFMSGLGAERIIYRREAEYRLDLVRTAALAAADMS